MAADVKFKSGVTVRLTFVRLPECTYVTELMFSCAEDQTSIADRSRHDHICSVSLAGAEHEHRRHLFKILIESAWKSSTG